MRGGRSNHHVVLQEHGKRGVVELGWLRHKHCRRVLRWRKRFRTRFEIIAERYPPRIEVDFDELADMLAALADGGIIVSKVVRDPRVLPQQILLYRSFVRSVFLGA